MRSIPKIARLLLAVMVVSGALCYIAGWSEMHPEHIPYSDSSTVRRHGLAVDEEGLLYVGERSRVVAYDGNGAAATTYSVLPAKSSLRRHYSFTYESGYVVIWYTTDNEENFIRIYARDGKPLYTGFDCSRPENTEAERRRAEATDGTIYEIRRRFLRREEVVKIAPDGKETVLTRIRISTILRTVSFPICAASAVLLLLLAIYANHEEQAKNFPAATPMVVFFLPLLFLALICASSCAKSYLARHNPSPAPYTDHLTLHHRGVDVDEQGMLYLGNGEYVTRYDANGQRVQSYDASPPSALSSAYRFEVLDGAVIIWLTPKDTPGQLLVYSVDGWLLFSEQSDYPQQKTDAEHDRAEAPDGTIYEIRRRFLRREEVVKIAPDGKETVLTRPSGWIVAYHVLMPLGVLGLVASVFVFIAFFFMSPEEAEDNKNRRIESSGGFSRF